MAMRYNNVGERNNDLRVIALLLPDRVTKSFSDDAEAALGGEDVMCGKISCETTISGTRRKRMALAIIAEARHELSGVKGTGTSTLRGSTNAYLLWEIDDSRSCHLEHHEMFTTRTKRDCDTIN